MTPTRCAIYTRKSVEEGLDQPFTSLDAQRDSCAAYIKSQALEGWTIVGPSYDDGGFSGANMQRPELQRLLRDVERGLIDTVVVYKIDRLSRSLTDFAKIVEHLERHSVAFISVTQAFNTSSSVGRLTLNVLLTFAQFERELIGERLRDKIAASRARGIFTGGRPAIGYRFRNGKLVLAKREAQLVRRIFTRFVSLGSVGEVARELHADGIRKPPYVTRTGRKLPSSKWWEGPLRNILSNRIYVGDLKHRAKYYPGEHRPIVDRATFEAAQRQLQAIRQRWDHSRTIGSSALLTGLIVDDKGNTMTPYLAAQSQHRTYHSQAAHRKLDPDVITVRTAVVDPLVLRCVNACSPRSLRVSNPRNRSNRRRIRQVVQKVVVAADGIRVELRRERSAETRDPDLSQLADAQVSANEKAWTVFFPLNLEPAGPVRVIEGWRGSLEPSAIDQPTPLLKALALAYRMRRRIERNEVVNLEGLARQENLSTRIVLRTLRLAYLAPEIQKQIVDGRIPDKLANWPREVPNLPLDWRRQRQLLGMP